MFCGEHRPQAVTLAFYRPSSVQALTFSNQALSLDRGLLIGRQRISLRICAKHSRGCPDYLPLGLRQPHAPWLVEPVLFSVISVPIILLIVISSDIIV